MKRLPILLLCFLLLFCIGCKKEETPQDPSETEFQSVMPASSFYVLNDTDVYNTFVRIEATPQEQTAPVTALTTKICNDTDFILQFNFDLDAFYEWEKWEGGKWVTYSHQVGSNELDIELNRATLYPGPHYIMPHSAHTRTEDFSDHPLEAGLYRLRIEYKLTNETKKFADGFHQTPGVLCVVEGYVTVEAAPQS